MSTLSMAGIWRWLRRQVHHRTAHLSPTARALLWAAGAGLLFSLLNGVMRGLAQQINPFQAQFCVTPVVLPCWCPCC